MSTRLRIGELLINLGQITQAQLELALAHQKSADGAGKRLGQVLVDLEYVNEGQLTKVLSQHLSVPWVSLHHVDFSRQLLNLVPHELAEHYCVIPIYVRKERKTGDTLYLAMEDPTHEEAIRKITEASGMPVKTMIAAPSDIRGAIRAFYGAPSRPAPPPDPLDAPPPVVLSVVAKPLSPPPPPPAAPRAKPPPPPPAARPSAPDLTPAAPIIPPEPPVVAPTPAAGVAMPSMPTPSSPRAVIQRGWKSSASTPVATPKKSGAKMITLTLLDGVTIQIPAQKKKGAQPAAATPAEEHGTEDRLTTRDLIVALRAVAAGANPDEALGDARWETIVAALLAVLLKKQLLADWEFVEEWQT